MFDMSSLNENQLEAVLWDNGPLLVLAGPGSGKTRVLTYRIAHILEVSKGQHFRILALTFTNKAAAEMRNRVEELVPKELSRVRLTTFHSYVSELLQQHGNHINFQPNFQILSNDADRESLLDDVLGTLRKDLSFSMPQHFKAYREALRGANCLDFPSLIAESLDLLNKHPFLAKHIRKVYKHILIDEFQDTNQSQYQILSCIIKPDPSTLFAVADDDQIIYQWNGASPKRIQLLREDFNVSELQLPENYRCPPFVIKLANALIEKNLNRFVGKKPLTSVKQGINEQSVRVFSFKDLEDEVTWIAEDIAQ